MPQYSVIDEVFVKFEPTGSLADMDFTQAIERLNKTEKSLELNWQTVGEGGVKSSDYKPTGDLVELVTGTLGKGVDSERTEPAFSVLSYEDGLLKINILDTPDGKGLMQVMDNGVDIRFSAFVDIAEDPTKAVAFSRFYVVMRDVETETPKAPVESSLIMLPGKDFSLDNPMGI